MQRQIKFRGKTYITNGFSTSEWIYGYFLEKELCDGMGRCSYIKYDGSSEVKVIPETVGQFTGLYDTKGKEIYEGDIVMLSGGDISGEVIYRGTSFCNLWRNVECLDGKIKDVCMSLIPDGHSDFECVDMYQIVGNIHDTPEVLGAKYEYNNQKQKYELEIGG
jgi:uncharacterized phage protein (TIGR01671 family)